jgi:hypothetical protein
MADLTYPPFARLVFRELDGGEPVTAGELPAGLTVDDYVWLREMTRRYRELLKSGIRRPSPFDAFPKN